MPPTARCQLVIGAARPVFLMTVGIVLAVTLISTPWVSTKLAVLWESSELSCNIPSCPNADAVVVLGGESMPVDSSNPDRSRVLRGIALVQAGHARHLVLSGGSAGKTTEARLMASVALSHRLAADRLILEEESRNTSENARHTATISRRMNIRRVILVTHALHMPRAAASFRDQGFEVVPSSVSRLQTLPVPSATSWKPDLASFNLSMHVMHEVAGMAISGLWENYGVFADARESFDDSYREQ
jgi:uncharacterized SAM-binding protein YcdF (DUF218 family)